MERFRWQFRNDSENQISNQAKSNKNLGRNAIRVVNKLEQTDTNEAKEPADFHAEVNDYFIEKIQSKEYSDLMDPVVRELDTHTVESIYEGFSMWGKDTSYRETAEFLADAMGIKMPVIKNFIVSTEEKHKYPTALFSDSEYSISFFIDKQKKDTDNEDDGTFLKSIEMISHEMWHAFQYTEEQNGGERAEIYKQKQKFTAEEIKNPIIYLEYIKQPIETEAYVFGKKFSVRFANILKNILEKKHTDNMKMVDEEDPWSVTDTEHTKKQLMSVENFLNKDISKTINQLEICNYLIES